MLTIQSDNGKQGYKVGGKKYCRPKVVPRSLKRAFFKLLGSPFPAALAVDMAAIGFGDARNPELAACRARLSRTRQRRVRSPWRAGCEIFICT